ncbi:hypothetical protein [Streptomyces sp. NPDC012510]|jgi:hypothetical protein|uniref:hypothetical protein n=1 Tax=Streptomyces sp. NPDC012510 TaxID=3364838 RepID=UPI0036E7F151
MTEQPDPTQGASLTPTQAIRRDFARQGLDEARNARLADLEPHRLILLVERLTGELDAMLHLVDEITGATPRSPNGNP